MVWSGLDSAAGSHRKKTQRPMVEDEAIANQLEALLTPAITNQENYYRQLGLRDRIRLIEIRSGKIFSRQAS